VRIRVYTQKARPLTDFEGGVGCLMKSNFNALCYGNNKINYLFSTMLSYASSNVLWYGDTVTIPLLNN